MHRPVNALGQVHVARGQRHVGFVGTRQAAEAAAVTHSILELVHDRDQAVQELPVAVLEKSVAPAGLEVVVPVQLAALVRRIANAAAVDADVIQPEATPAQRSEDRADGRLRLPPSIPLRAVESYVLHPAYIFAYSDDPSKIYTGVHPRTKMTSSPSSYRRASRSR